MIAVAEILFWILIGSLASQLFLVAGFIRALRRSHRDGGSVDYHPKAAVVLCLRGTDPFLPECIRGILSQDYPCFDLQIVVDCVEDPAWQVVEEVIEQHRAANVRVRPLEERRDTCSLKCSSVVQAISELDESYEVIALVDADTLAHSTWLAELVAPLADPRVGAATGNRWYMPQDAAWGSLVRYLWNAAAVVQMYWYGIAWGGTLAIRIETLKRTGLLERWKMSFCEDTMLFGVLRKHALRVAFVPSLMMINREGCDMAGYFGWVRRQLLTARLYHPGWVAVAFHGVSTSLVLLAGCVLAIFAAATGEREALGWTVAGLVAYEAGMLGAIALLETAVRPIARRRGQGVDWLWPAKTAKIAVSLGLTQMVYAVAVVTVMRVRTVVWRGIGYQIEGPWQIRLLRYEPYVAPTAVADPLASL